LLLKTQIPSIETEIPKFKGELKALLEKHSFVNGEIEELERASELASRNWYYKWRRESLAVFSRHWGMILFGLLFFITPIARWTWRAFVWIVPGILTERYARGLQFESKHLHTDSESGLVVRPNQTSITLSLTSGREVWVRDAWLRSSSVEKTSKVRLTWFASTRFWIMSLLHGLWLMNRFIGNSGTKSETVQIANSEDLLTEFALVELERGSSIILRPRHIVAMDFQSEFPPVFNRYWRINQIAAWIFGQVCFFEISGPIKLVVRGARGVMRTSVCNSEATHTVRLKLQGLIAFSPRLRICAHRTENSWQYIFGEGPVFDYLFTGEGSFITEQGGGVSSRQKSMLEWINGMGESALKLCGL
jgi:uncharacterized protein (AIM24 family)